jgi:hypothetical protein
VDADTVVYLLAAGLIALAQILVVVTTRPRPASPLEVAYVAAPAAGVIALLVLAWRSVSG